MRSRYTLRARKNDLSLLLDVLAEHRGLVKGATRCRLDLRPVHESAMLGPQGYATQSPTSD